MEALQGITAFAALVSLGAGMGYALGATVLGALRPRRPAQPHPRR
jgi:hypothetical protein